MSFWGATVITNLFSAIPIIGDPIVTWLWGGFSVDNATLNRFFSLHFLLPFVIFGVVGLHVVALHIVGSNNPDGIDIKPGSDTVPFTPYFTAKDSVGLIAFVLIFAVFVFFMPNYMGHPDNYIEANPLQLLHTSFPNGIFYLSTQCSAPLPSSFSGLFRPNLAAF